MTPQACVSKSFKSYLRTNLTYGVGHLQINQDKPLDASDNLMSVPDPNLNHTCDTGFLRLRRKKPGLIVTSYSSDLS